MKHFKKLNAKGFAHVELVMIVVVIAAIGAIGSNVMLRKGHADISPVTVCGSGYKQTGAYYLYAGNSRGPVVLHVLVNKGSQQICSVLLSTGNAYGVSKPMSLSMKIINSSGYTVRSAGKDSGTYKYYVGPLKVSYKGLNLTHNALYVSGSMTYGGKTYTAHWPYSLASYVN